MIEGLRHGSFWTMGPPSASVEMATLKARSIVDRTAPDYLVDVLAKSARSEGSSK